MATIKKLYFANGTDVTTPVDLAFESSTSSLETYADDAAFVADNGTAVNGDIYLNSTVNAPRAYIGGAWRTALVNSDISDATKQIDIDLSGVTTGKTQTLTFIGTDNRAYTFPDVDGILAINTGTYNDPVLFGDATGNIAIGGVSSTASIEGTGALKLPSGTTAERPGSPSDSMIRYNSDTATFEGYQGGVWAAIAGGGGGSGGTLDVNQTAHGFAVGDALYFTGSAYAKAQADAEATYYVVGVVGVVTNANNFKLAMSGEVSGLSGLTSGAIYYLSETVAGQLEDAKPLDLSSFVVPVAAATSATTMIVDLKAGEIIGPSLEGEINAVLNSSAKNSIVGWVDGSSHTTSRVTSGSPLDPVVSTALSIAASTTAAESSTSGSYYTLSMPTGLRNKKLKIEFYMTSNAAHQWTVGLYSGATRATLSTDSSGASNIPAGFTGKYTTYFDSDGSSSYTLHFTRTAGSGSDTLVVTSVVVGPGIQSQGAVIGEWKSYTPNTVNFGSGTGLTASWRRVGSDLEARVQFTSGTHAAGLATISLPTGLNVSSDTSIIPSIAASNGGNGFTVGYWTADETTGTTGSMGSVLVATATDTSVVYLGGGAGSSTATPTAAHFINSNNINNSRIFTFNFSVPIAEWSGSGTLNTAQNDVEYASNFSTSTTTSDTTSFSYGPSGNLTSAITSTLTRRVKFVSPILPTDKLTIEVSFDRVKWVQLDAWLYNGASAIVEPLNLEAVQYAGMGFDFQSAVSQYEVAVTFGSKSAHQGLDLYGAASHAWPASGLYWRVKKEKAGTAVGFGLASTDGSAGLYKPGQAPGLTSGATVLSKNIGEKITSGAISTTAVASPTYVDVTGASITLSAGVWMVYANVFLRVDQSGGGLISCGLYDSSNVFQGGNATLKTFDGGKSGKSFQVYVNIASSTTYKLRIASSGATSSLEVVDQVAVNDAYNTFYAVRIA